MAISVEEMRRIEKKAEEIGISNLILMENAGANAARIVNEKVGLKNKKVLVFCGIGNNAGDGFVFARHALIYGAELYLWLIKNPEFIKTEAARTNFNILKELKQTGANINFYIEKMPELKADILVDALLGIGIKGNVSEDYAKAIEKFNSMEGFKVSIDCPSGIDADTGKILGTIAKPDITITFHDVKRGMTRENSGEIIIADIGIPRF
jgi:NAD(P)H-hydrate epimerase